MTRSNEPVTFSAELKHETDMAWLLVSHETGEEAWVPKSVAEFYEDDGEVTMPRWMAEEKGLL